MSMLPHNYQGATPGQQIVANNSYQQPIFPIKLFPTIIAKAIIATCVNKNVPIEIAASAYLAAASLSCLPLVEAIPAHTTIPEPAVLNLLVIADSGFGKSTALRSVMQVFHDFSFQVNQEYKELLKKYQVDWRLWKEKEKALSRNVRQATTHRYLNEEDENIVLEAHLQNEPQKPVRFKFLYQDISRGELLKNVEDNPEAGIISGEGITFFKSRAKEDPGAYNLGWDGAPYLYQRDGVDCEVTLRLMFCLMVQPDVFDEYLAKHKNSGRGSGFLARFLMAKVDEIPDYYTERDFSKLNSAFAVFDNRVLELLELAKRRFYCGLSDKEQLTLASETMLLIGEKRAEMKQKIAKGGPYEHIPDIALKSDANALRLATIFHHFSKEPGDVISSSEMERAYEIIEWYMAQACRVFYQDSSLSLFEKDVLEVYHWIHNYMTEKGRAIISKSEIMRLGPKHKSNNLREARKLVPILEQLAWQKRILLLQNARGGSIHIILPNQWGVFQDPSVRIDIFPHGCRYLPTPEIPGRVALNLPNLFFTW